MRCSVNRLLQLATKPRLQSMRSDTLSHVWPSASSKISRARRESSARSVRLLARRVSSISSEFDNVMASLMDAIIVYKWLLQSTRRIIGRERGHRRALVPRGTLVFCLRRQQRNHSRQRGSWPRLTKNAGPRMEQTAKKAGKKLAPLIFDHQELPARVENDRELLRDLLTIFKEDF